MLAASAKVRWPSLKGPMPALSAPETSAKRLLVIYRIAMTFAIVLLILPAGCWMVDFAMWFVNGAAVAAYSFAMGMAARTSRGFAAAVTCAALGLTHPAWVLLTVPAARAVGVLPPAAGTALEYMTEFGATAAVFGVALAACLVSLLPILLLSAAAALAPRFLWIIQPWLLAWSPLGGLWPSGLSFPAGTLHLGIATSLWLCLSRSITVESLRVRAELTAQ